MISNKIIFINLAVLVIFTNGSYPDINSSLDLPSNLFWGKEKGISYLTVSRNIKNLEYCSGSWALAATTVLSDRFKVLRNASWPDYSISPQVALSCISSVQGCSEEGDPTLVYDYILNNGITDETCAIYQARDFSNGAPCDRLAICKTCFPNGKCDIPSKYYLYNITGYTVAKGETQMLTALQSGPIACRLNSTNEFVEYNSMDDILVPTKSPSNGTIYVSIVGYGIDSFGTKYWMGRNSWGTSWGDIGFFNLIRGTDALGIEEYCVYPTPNLTVTVVTTNSQGIEERTFINNFELPKYLEEPANSFRAKQAEDKALAAVPSAWDWRNAKGKNYLSWVRNQNIPQYCEASWAFAPASSVTDRLNILHFNDTFPQFIISPQDIINNGVGNCSSGDVSALYRDFLQNGYSDDTCLQYVADNSSTFDCYNCVPPAPQEGKNSYCSPIAPPFLFKVSRYKNLAGATKMMQEIYTNGPITCGIYASKGFANYTGGIYSEISKISTISQYISLVGWGVDPSTKIQYWIGRNSWGTGWGEYGFFRMQMFRDNLGIETDCVAAVPIFG
ncbi:unnamed protein product [Blepharisma stoltei]|uniref:Peptidase C1A papain C-terminal domain-containing protein n=1 Tax=Blepharisma stoltei TaxID=1481888 RepID=A0AAU9IXY6_9CILI|nr:unnamed protein product [Blepharisma stoltei]